MATSSNKKRSRAPAWRQRERSNARSAHPSRDVSRPTSPWATTTRPPAHAKVCSCQLLSRPCVETAPVVALATHLPMGRTARRSSVRSLTPPAHGRRAFQHCRQCPPRFIHAALSMTGDPAVTESVSSCPHSTSMRPRKNAIAGRWDVKREIPNSNVFPYLYTHHEHDSP